MTKLKAVIISILILIASTDVFAASGAVVPVKVSFNGAGAPEETFVIVTEGGGIYEEKEVPLSSGAKSTIELNLPPGTYTVKEKNGSAEKVAYSSLEYTVYVTVKEDETYEVLITEKTTQSKPDEITFTNYYNQKPSEVIGDPPIRVKKTIEGNAPKKTFTFELKPDNPNFPLPPTTKKTLTDEGEFEFGNIRFTEEGIYTYKIYEIDESQNGWAYDDAVYNIKYTVARNQNNELTCVREMNRNKKEPAEVCEFTNYYGPGSAIRKGVKTGDPRVMGPITILFCVSVIGLAFIIRRRRNENKKD